MSAPYREPTYVGDLAEPRCSFPVIVTVEMTHVIWVEADDQDAAFERARHDTYERLDDQETLAGHDLRLRRPGEDFHSWDWDTIYDGEYLMPYSGQRCDAHVEARNRHLHAEKRRAEKAACAEAGHPGSEARRWSADRPTRMHCPMVCGWLDADQADPSAAGGEPSGDSSRESDLQGGAA